MPRTILNPRGAGAVSNWAVSNGLSGWEAIQKDSPDSTYITSSTPTAKSTFDCAGTRQPLCGVITAVTLHYRIRKNTNVSTGGSVNAIVVQGVTEYVVGSLVPPESGAWLEGVIRIREDWTSTTRFSGADVEKLGVGVVVVTAPSIGAFEVSQLWLAVEYVDTPYIYDPYRGVLPDAVVGPLSFSTTGTQSASLTGSNYLSIADTSITDWRDYRWIGPTPKYTVQYVSTIEVRLIINALPVASTGFVCTVCYLLEEERPVGIGILKWNGQTYLGIYDYGTDLNDPSTYKDLAPLQVLNTDVHFTVVVDRSVGLLTRGKVQVFVDYDSTPLVDIWYEALEFYAAGSSTLVFGTDDLHECTVLFDFVAWKTSKGMRNTFPFWEELDTENNEVTLDKTVAELAPIILINPPGQYIGQSDQACRLTIEVPTEVCQINQAFYDKYGTPDTYSLTLDYVSSTGAFAAGRIYVQRCSDLWYWDNGAVNWSSTFSAVTIPAATVRTRTTFITGVVNAAPESFIVTIDRNPAAASSYVFWLYKAYLERI